MKILFFCNYGLLFGANRSLFTLAEYFHKVKGYQVLVLVPAKGSMADELEKQGIPHKVIRCFPTFLYVKPIAKHLLLPFCILYNIIVFPSLLSFAHKYNPNIIYSNTSAENLGILIARFLGIRHISHIREFMSLDHDAHFIFGNSFKRKYINLSNGIVFVSRAVAQFVLQNRELSSKHKVIYNGVEVDSKEIADKSLPSFINLGVVGVLQESKGHHVAIEYFSKIADKYPDAKLNIIGDGYDFYEKRLRKLVEQYRLEDRVVFHGFIKNADEIYQKLDVLLMVSRAEGFGRVTIEAMLRGIPVLGLEAGGTTEIIRHNATGYLFSDVVSFEQSLRQLLSSVGNYNMIRRQAYEEAISSYSSERYCTEVNEFIEQIIKSKR